MENFGLVVLLSLVSVVGAEVVWRIQYFLTVGYTLRDTGTNDRKVCRPLTVVCYQYCVVNSNVL